MSIQTYILKMKNNKNISFTALAKEIGITYTNLIKLKDGDIAFPSDKVLEALSKYEKREKQEILLDILLDDVSPEFDLNTIRYLCKMSCEGYVLNLEPELKGEMDMKTTSFEALIVKKRFGKRYTLVDSWNTAKRRYWEEKFRLEYNDDLFMDLPGIRNEHEYVKEVINYSIQRIALLNDPTIKKYQVLFLDNTKEAWQQGNALRYAVKPKGLRLECILVEPKKDK